MSRLIRAITRRLAHEDGWSLVEMMAAIMIFAITAIMVAGTLIKAAQWTRDVRFRTTAAHLAQQDISIVKAVPFSNIPRDTTTRTRVVDGREFTVTRSATLVPRHSVGSACAASGGDSTSYLRVMIRVAWDEMGTTKQVQHDTVIAPRPGDLDPNTGNVGVKVIDGAGDAVSGLQVSGNPGNQVGAATTTKTTDPNGCAFFDSVTPGSYTYWITDNAFVDPTGKAGPANASSTSVAATQTNYLGFTVARAGTLSVTPADQSTYPLATEAPLVLYNTAFANATQTLTVAGSSWPREVAPLFPSPSGYVLWAGTCADADPGANRPAPVAVTAGGSNSVTLAAGKFDAALATGEGAGTVLVTAEHAVDAGCTSGASYTFAPAGPSPTSLKASLPYGQWTLKMTVGGQQVGSDVPINLAATATTPTQLALGTP